MGEPIPIFAEAGWAYRDTVSKARLRINRAKAPSERAREWPKALFGEEPIRYTGLRDHLLRVAHSGKLVVSLSHDHYISMPGGVQNCVGDEQHWATENGVAYLHLCPNAPLPLLGDNGDVATTMLVASLDGRRLGVVSMKDVLQSITDLRHTSADIRTVVHHLLGFAPEHVLLLHEACGTPNAPMMFWVHDLFTLCPSVHLLRNDAAFCYGPAVSSQACRVCHAGADRHSHVARMSDFFDAVRPFILAPSATILDFWRASGKYQHLGSAVVPPCDLMQTNITPQFQSGRALRVAFLGAPTYEKGWDAFESLVRWHSQDPRYEFFHFSWAPADVPGLRKVPVTVTRSNRMAMVDAVREAGIDVVINWSLCFESFSFTAHEALAAGTYLIARRGSGHVERVVAESDGNGCIVGSDIELHAMFATDEVIAKLASSARRCAVLQPGIGAGSILREVWAGERKHA